MNTQEERTYTFPKSEHLCGDKAVNALFMHGKAFVKYPLRVVAMPSDGEVSRMLVSVPKKRFKRAVKRNRVKRLVREAYRLNKHLLQGTPALNIAFVYIDNDLPSFRQIESAMQAALRRLHETYATPHDEPQQ